MSVHGIQESHIKADLVKELRASLPRFVIIRHEDRITSGIPDISATGGGFTTWIECKFADPKFQSKGIQELTMSRLSLAAFQAIYIVWRIHKGHKFTYKVHPGDIGKPFEGWTNYKEGFDHKWIAEIIKETHNVNYYRP